MNFYKSDGAAAWAHGGPAFDERRAKFARARNIGGAASAAPVFQIMLKIRVVIRAFEIDVAKGAQKQTVLENL